MILSIGSNVPPLATALGPSPTAFLYDASSLYVSNVIPGAIIDKAFFAFVSILAILLSVITLGDF